MAVTTSGSWASLSKGRAFAIHLILSILIFSTLVMMMVVWWFPGELFFLDGGWQGLKIVALIDLVLGPALTLLLYKPNKPKLLLDMSLVAGIQIAALVYGFYTTHQQRTVAVVYADRNFTTLSANAVENAEKELIEKERKPQSIAQLDNSTPAMILTPEPGPGEFKEYMSELFGGFPEPHERLDLFVKRGPEHAEHLTKHAVTREKMERTGVDKIIDKAIAKGGFDKNDIELHHFKARYAKGLVIFSKSEQKILDYVAVDWRALIDQKKAEAEAKVSTEPTMDDQSDVMSVKPTDVSPADESLAESDEQ